MGAAALPIAMIGSSAIGAGGSAYAGSKAKSAMQYRSPQEQALMGAQTNLARQQASQGQQLFATGLPAIQQASGYYSRLLGGSRAGLREAVAPEAAGIRDSYRGAGGAISRMLRGGERDLAMGRLAQSQAGQLGGLTMGVRPAAAGALGNLGMGSVYPGLTGGASAGSMYGGLLGTEAARSMGSANLGYSAATGTAKEFGSLIADLLKYGQKQGWFGGAAKTT